MRKRYSQKKQDFKIDVLDMEKIELNTFYTLTLNKAVLRPTIMENIRDYQKIIARYIQNYASFILLPELSKVGKLHYHGMISFESYENIFFFYQNSLNMGCAIEIDTIKDMDIWYTYITKQKKFASQYHRCLQPYKIHNLPKGSKVNDHIDDILQASASPL